MPPASHVRTNAVIYLAFAIPQLFADVDTIDITDPTKHGVAQVSSKFAMIFRYAPRWWEPDQAAHIPATKLDALNVWLKGLAGDMQKNGKDGERAPWTGAVLDYCGPWAVAAGRWDKEVCPQLWLWSEFPTFCRSKPP